MATEPLSQPHESLRSIGSTRNAAGPKEDSRRYRRMSLTLMLMRVGGIAEQRTPGPTLMSVTVSKRHMAYVETAYSPCQFSIGRLARFNLISHSGEKGCSPNQ